ncbi:MarR family transcriptional regulator [Nitratireductor sp. ZSWI3]|uniref:MarR family transcriptional regulator n=1 Tax=Nitratireductor sp. ZSWI3 TaxID=2966359 RepID=UPI00214F784D|nr:MarR family transcriptional regulator [Nitratireductor sp. ZSWI3]MCR4268859.1 MarR family transcriptional regulator [Nitratireductor sp. ZSWI3]
MKTKNEDGSSTVALQNGLELVRLLSDEGPMTVDELARQASLRNETTARLIKTLELQGFVESTRFAGRYQPGRMATALSEAFLENTPVIEVARPVMQALADNQRMTVSLAVSESDRALSLLICRGAGRNVVPGHIGCLSSMTRSAAGHALLFTACAHREQLRIIAQETEGESAAAEKLEESAAFFRTSGCFRLLDVEQDVLQLAAPLHLSNAVLALEATLPDASGHTREIAGIIGDLLRAVELIQQKSAAAGVRYLED